MRWLVVLAVLAVGCRFDTSGSAGSEPTADADSTDPDGSQIDAAADIDGAAIDGASIDATTTFEERCASRYGSLDGYDFCAGTEDQCDFVIQLNNMSCATHCASVGGTCLGADDTSLDSGQPCVVTDTGPDCNTTNLTSLLCYCDQER